MSGDRRREKMGYYWYELQKNKRENLGEKLFCKLCGKLIQPGSTPQLRYGVGIICKECSDKRWKKSELDRV